MKTRVAETCFVAVRYDTPHPVIDLHEVGSDLVWRVKAEMLTYELPPVRAEAELIRDRLRCRCTRCGQRTERKGGKNINHKFICAGCLQHGRRNRSQDIQEVTALPRTSGEAGDA